jgi:hypothetical protein
MASVESETSGERSTGAVIETAKFEDVAPGQERQAATGSAIGAGRVMSSGAGAEWPTPRVS